MESCRIQDCLSNSCFEGLPWCVNKKSSVVCVLNNEQNYPQTALGVTLGHLGSRTAFLPVEEATSKMSFLSEGGGWDELGDWDWHIYAIDTMYKIR